MATSVRPHVPTPGMYPGSCGTCPLPRKNTRFHLDWESQDPTEDHSEPRHRPDARPDEPPPAQLPLP